ncbi:uncharacterized protein [Amphiura filiformis]|uniref:uncharacterized protein n=1 Tax=Amphiura filiformis TaxID=82378 RepID=UPI003B2261B2
MSRMATQELGFKCRRCRVYLFGDDSILTASDDGTASFVWYLKEESHPDWIQHAIIEAQWTKGKLNCPKCHGRLGSFDFITPNKTQLSEAVFSSIQIIKNRVDCEPTKSIIDRVQKINKAAIGMKEESTTNIKSTRTGKMPVQHALNQSEDQPHALISSYDEATAAITAADKRNRCKESNLSCNMSLVEDTTHSNQSNDCNRYRVQNMCDNDRKLSDERTNQNHEENMYVNESVHQAGSEECVRENEQSMAVRRRHLPQSSESTSNVQSDINYTNNQSRTEHIMSCNETIERTSEQNENMDRTRDVQEERSEMNNLSQNINDNTMDAATCTGNPQFIGMSFDGESSTSWEDFFEEIIDEIEESRMLSSQDGMNYNFQEDDDLDLSQNLVDLGHDVSPSRVRARERAALRRERNRRKKERRKQRRKEKWMESHNYYQEDQEPANLSGLVDILGTDWNRQALQEVTTCSICLDVFYQPHSCVPCNHIFCEPCLRQLASVHHVVAPCPLCRTSIQTVVEHFELTAAIKKLFPTQVQRRREAERRTLHRSFPLPGHSSLSSITRPWFSIPRFRTSDTNEHVRQFTSRVNHVRQRRQELNRTFIQEISGETLATLMFFAVTVGVIVAFLSLMQEFT